MWKKVRGLEPLGVSWGHVTHELAANSDLKLRNCILHTTEFKKKKTFFHHFGTHHGNFV